MVYFIGNKEHKFVKIGKAKNVFARFQYIQVSCPYNLELFLTIEGNEAIEKAIHLLFKHLHIRGEWFQLTPEIEEFMKNPIIQPLNNVRERKYDTTLEDNVINLYKENPSNIWIAEQLSVSLTKVQRIIKLNKLAENKLTICEPGYYTNASHRNKAYKRFKQGKITQEELDKILLKYPKRCEKRGKRFIPKP